MRDLCPSRENHPIEISEVAKEEDVLVHAAISRCSNRGAMKVWEESNGEAIQANKAAVKPCLAKVKATVFYA